ncbi:hypothetical protein [Seonamhaeicola marinus]|uniref:Uncharacterized protein n=1 Tax=Seonamhaeicola marinus TaxID=1912246 RepID=A0A5D0HWP3_9FLAO|nr:hypothetical protein [Seonamhaeicola marinus]TYA74939.1 hypothetical protein FUA24_16705 [Seonamhaeicola marinus]
MNQESDPKRPRNRGTQKPPKLASDFKTELGRYANEKSKTKQAKLISKIVNQRLNSGEKKYLLYRDAIPRKEEVHIINGIKTYETSFSHTSMIRLEKDDHEPDYRTLLKMACFCGYDYQYADDLIYGRISKEINWTEHLEGAWHVYYHDAKQKSVRRTVLWMDKDGQKLKTFLRTPFNDKTEKVGTAVISKNKVLTIKMDSELPEICISAELPKKSNEKYGERWILNAVGLVYGDTAPITVSMVLLKHLKIHSHEILFSKANKSVVYQHLNESENSTTSFQSLVNEIVIYLTRHRDRIIKPFLETSKNSIHDRNAAYLEKRHRTHFKELKQQFEKNNAQNKSWYSFSRIRPERNKIAFFRWNFTYNGSRHEILASRKRHGKSNYEGEVTYRQNHLHISMTSAIKGDNKSKNFKAIYSLQKDNFIIQGISSTINPDTDFDESPHMAVREILFYADDSLFSESELKKGIISYDRFLDFKGISDHSKLYLSIRDFSTLSYPHPKSEQKHFYRMSKARQYAGEYFVLLRYLYPTKGGIIPEWLFLISLSIDKLAYATLKVKYPNKDKITSYYGSAEYYSKNIHIHLESNLDDDDGYKIANLVLNDIDINVSEKPDFFTGVALNTNREYKATGFPFVMIPKHQFKQFPFKMGTLKTLPEELETLIQKNLGKTSNEYFFS